MIRNAFWNIVFSLFFAALLFLGMKWLYENGKMVTSISTVDFFLITLATFRLIRLFSYDLITKFLRDAFSLAPHNSFLGTLGALLHCPWCTGLWFSAFVLFFYLATPLAWPLILVLALAGTASFIQILANLVGWTAESKKRKALALTVSETPTTNTCG